MWEYCICGDFYYYQFIIIASGCWGTSILFNGSAIVAVRYGEKTKQLLQTA